MRNFKKGEVIYYNFKGEKLIPSTIKSIKQNGDIVAITRYGIHTIRRESFPNYLNANKEPLSDAVVVRFQSHRSGYSISGEKTLLEWVYEVLNEYKRPMHYSEIRRVLLERGYEAPIEPDESRTPIECRIKTRIVEANERGDFSIVKVAPATYQIQQ